MAVSKKEMRQDLEDHEKRLKELSSNPLTAAKNSVLIYHYKKIIKELKAALK